MIFRLDLFINDSNKSLQIFKLLDICANVEINNFETQLIQFTDQEKVTTKVPDSRN